MKRLRICLQKNACGQSLVEFALILPFFLLLIIGIAEVGFAFYDYLTLATANREGVRLASRARFTDESTASLISSSGGLVQQPDGTFAPAMKLSGSDANLGVIITHIAVDTNGVFLSSSTYVSGTILGADGTPRFITPSDTKFTAEELQTLLENSTLSTGQINTHREALAYDRIPEELVIVETFLTHQWLSSYIPLFGKATTLRFYSTMRVLRDSRDTVGGN
ncbi:MAG TPA: TadE/TadG family type IV pilus assembly protein [Anaerolineae bacterium]|nr:TadE/TadG family type IV pilus assembly protein [Anaerolineae bacterium]HQK13634.1 TadE/TadG family type IV pilus assembly protein [Anaerolineae bacterium]